MIRHDSGFISVSDFALACCYTPQAIRKAIKEDRLTAWRIGNQYVLRAKDVTGYAYDRSKTVHVKKRRKNGRR